MNSQIMMIVLLCAFQACGQITSKSSDKMDQVLPSDAVAPSSAQLDTAYFGAGCFWCVEAVFQELKGIYTVESGYMGGQVENPTYRQICTGTTGHAEIVKLTFDPTIISYEDLLEILWTTHDPTTLNQQGADRGTQYRSAVFYINETQKLAAQKSKVEVATKIWNDPIVTEISPTSTYYPAEKYHQNYYRDNANQGYCRVVINPKVAKVREKFADKLK